MLLHVPHWSNKIPNAKNMGYLVNKTELNDIKYFFADLYTDDLYGGGKKIKAKYSRVFVDVERFKDNSKESMSKLGMGMLYTHTHKGKKFCEPTPLHQKLAEKAYDKHHAKLDRLVDKEIKKYGKCLIVDCHSYSTELATSIFGENAICPDICIGYEDDFYDARIVETTKTFFENCGYSTMLNKPYSGSLVPNKAYAQKNPNVKSIMLEINKRTYLNGNKKSQNYKTLKRQIKTLLKQLKTIFYGD